MTAGVALACLGVLVGSDVLLHPERAIVGWNPVSDYQIMTWSLTWWPWAIGHGADPLHTHLLWAPVGFPTLWITAIPALALFALPVTLTLGPLLAYNALMFAAVGLAAGCAYLLCRELTGKTTPAVVGGLMFGLSPYMIGHTLSQHLNLTWIWPIPLVAWAIVRRFRGTWPNTRTFVAALAALLLVELGTSLEVFLDLTLVLCIAFVIAVAGPMRRDAIRTGMGVAFAYAVCLPLIGAVAYLALTTPHGALAYPPADYSIDAVNLVVPTQLSLLGAWGPVQGLSKHFVGNIGEQDGYLGLPAIVLVALAARARWRQGAWFALCLLIVLMVLSLGPLLTVQGRPVVGLPLSTARAPVLSDVLPARFSVFTMLLAACLASVWLALERRPWVRGVVAVLVLASLVPNVALSGRIQHAWGYSNVARFSTERAPAGFSLPGKNVLVLPTGDRTAAMYWQVRGHMRFRLAIPATPFVPRPLRAEPTVIGLLDETLLSVDGERLAAARLRAYLAQERIDAVAVTSAAPRWTSIAALATDSRPRRVGSALVYGVDRRLPGLPAVGEVASAGPLSAWIRFDGRRGHLEVRLGAGPAVSVSAPSGDAEQTDVAVGADGRAAVLFTEWHGDTLLVRVATHEHGGPWRVATVDRRTQPVWSPSIVVAPGGATVATWIDEVQPLRLVRAAARVAGGRWQGTVTLDDADGLAAVELAAGGDGTVLLAWHDSLANEERVRVATYSQAGWARTMTVGSAVPSLELRALGGNASLVQWRAGGHIHIWRREETR
ncbi:MAG TPA: hypothetical protein VGG88_09755 [Gaiellaceae bacterium]